MALSTSKFLTWTKGDRKHASPGMVQIPVEYIEIKGLEYGRCAKGSRKADRKPLPLNFSDPRSSSNAPTDSFTLHEAAVQSATSLIAAMSDMLKSPQFIPNPGSGGLYPVQGRPRSRTAPPTPATPLVEASHPDPVELPGSQPIWPKSGFKAKPPFLDPLYHTTISNAALAGSIQQSHSSPREPTFEKLSYIKCASDGPFPSLASRPSLDSTLRRSDDVFRAQPFPRASLVHGQSETGIAPLKAKPHHKHKHSQSLTAPCSTPDSDKVGPTPRAIGEGEHLLRKQSSSGRPESVFMDQITTMRAAHESHVVALKSAHEQELAFQRAYIALLEQRRTLSQSRRVDQEGLLTIDNTQICKGTSVYGDDASRTASLQSLESLLGDEKRASSEAVAQAETLRRKLSLAHKTQAGLDDIRRERDHFRELSEHNERRVTQLKGIVRKAKENEQFHESAMASLEASLVAANMQRIDVLAGLDDAERRICELERRTANEVDNAEAVQNKLNTALAGADALNAQLSSCHRQLKALELDRDRYSSL